MSSPPGDLTARARIRDAAIDLFAERGAAATVRDIAQRAGVSSGLLRHHFGSKEGLRDACDEYALAQLADLRARLFTATAGAEAPGLLAGAHPRVVRLQTYLVRSAVEHPDSPLLGVMAAAGRDWLAGAGVETADPQAYAAVLVAMQMGVFLLRGRLSGLLGVDAGTPAGHARVLRAMVEIFTQPLLTADQAARARALLDRLAVPEEAP